MANRDNSNRLHTVIIGSGAREHALAWKFAQSVLRPEITVIPGNALIAADFTTAPASSDSAQDLARAALAVNPHLIVCGPEGPLADGFADQVASLTSGSVPVWGPTAQGAQLESSKAFAKDVMSAAGVPTASFVKVSSELAARRQALIRLHDDRAVVLKASGLAAGKGVFVCESAADIDSALRHLYHTAMARAATEVVIEQCLVGRESSYFVMVCEGKATRRLGFAVDHKRLLDGDRGPNTGGMGCYSPVPWLSDRDADVVDERVVRPLLDELQKRDIKYTGFLYVGLMWTADGPQVIEFNVRFGDPEAQVLAVADGESDWLLHICNDLRVRVPISEQSPAADDGASGRRAQAQKKASAVAVTVASDGYPYISSAFSVTTPLAVLRESVASVVFGASVRPAEGAVEPAVSTSSGRVFTVVGRGVTLAAAQKNAYERVDHIIAKWPVAQIRRDIASAVIKDENG